VWHRFTELYPLLVDRLARSGEVDAVVPVLLQRAASAEVARGVRDVAARLAADGVGVPVYVCWVAPRSSRPHADLLQEAGVPCFEWPERTARALGHAARYGAARDRLRTAAVHVPVSRPSSPWPRPLPAGTLDVETAARLLTAAGIPLAAGQTCGSVADAVAAAEELGYPVVVKAVHPDLVHKSDVGGVRLGLTSRTAVGAAAADLLRLAPDVLVQPQLTGVEVVVGGMRDPQFGPVVLLGLGGVLVEAMDDVVLGVPPLHRDDVLRMVDGLRGRTALTGARGAEPVDTDALAAVVQRVGDLLLGVPEVTELDLNPVLATAAGCVAVDWHVRAGNPPAQDEDGGGV
jgi:acyl-CoA synthetase (NDP forming)